MELIDEVDLMVSCRVCLIKTQNPISLLESRNSQRIDEQIIFCTNLVIKVGENLPAVICTSCLEELDVAVNFKRKCDRSNQLLHKLLSEDKVIIENENKIEKSLYESYRKCNIMEKEYGRSNNNILKKLSNISEEKGKILCSDPSQGNSVDDAKDILSLSKNNGNSNNYEINYRRPIDVLNKNNLTCETCNLLCQNKWVLKVHMRTHSGEKPFQCEHCLKVFVSNSNMKMHLRTAHNSEKQVCSKCGKSFSCLAYLKRHLVIHSEVKPHECNICKKRFAKKTYLKEHIARHKGDKRFFCDICGAKFISSVNLKQHMIIHSIKNRNFRHHCTHCDYKTMGRVDLARHIRKHTGEKPFYCQHEGCQASFAGKSSLKLHIRIHTGEKPFKCTECPLKFSRQDKYKNHMLKKHNIVNVTCRDRSKLIMKELTEDQIESK